MRLLAPFSQEEIEGAMVHLDTSSRRKAIGWLRADLTDEEVADWLRGDSLHARFAREMYKADLDTVRRFVKHIRHWQAVTAKQTRALDEMIRNTSRGSPYNLPPWSYYQL